LEQAQQLPQGQGHHFAALLLQRRHIPGDLRRGAQDGLLFRMRIGPLDTFSARGLMPGERDPLMLWRQGADMRDEVARSKLDLDLVPGLAHFHAPPDPGDRNRVANGMHRDISFNVHRALMQTIHFRNPRRQRFQVPSLEGEQFARGALWARRGYVSCRPG